MERGLYEQLITVSLQSRLAAIDADEARTRMVPAGPELRIYYCGKFHRSEVVRDGRNVGEVPEEAKAEWLARGWVVE